MNRELMSSLNESTQRVVEILLCVLVFSVSGCRPIQLGPNGNEIKELRTTINGAAREAGYIKRDLLNKRLKASDADIREIERKYDNIVAEYQATLEILEYNIRQNVSLKKYQDAFLSNMVAVRTEYSSFTGFLEEVKQDGRLVRIETAGGASISIQLPDPYNVLSKMWQDYVNGYREMETQRRDKS